MLKRITIVNILLILLLNLFDLQVPNTINTSTNSNKINIIQEPSNNKKILDSFVYNNETHNNTQTINIIGKLDIPSINKSFNVLDTKDVNKGVSLLSNSNNLIIIAAHSGTGHLAYFNDLNKLNINELITYNNETFIITKITSIYKNGLLDINFNDLDKKLILTTCDQIDKNKQLVIITKKVD